jgi:hypothetical protein
MCDTLLYFSSQKDEVHSPLLVSHQSCSQKPGRGEQTIPESSQSGEGSPGMPLTFGLSRDPYLVADRPIMKNFGVVRKTFSEVSLLKVSQVCQGGFGLTHNLYLDAN